MKKKNFQYFSHLAELSRRSLFLKRKNWKFSDRETRLYNHTYLIGKTKNKKNKQNTLQFFYHLVNFLDHKILKKIILLKLYYQSKILLHKLDHLRLILFLSSYFSLVIVKYCIISFLYIYAYFINNYYI